MKCPNCNYIDGWNGEIGKSVKGSAGGFYKLSNHINLEREGIYEPDTIELCGCPNCLILFMTNQ